VFSARRFQDALETEAIGRYFVYRSVTETTMVLARGLADGGAPHGTLALAEEQRAGRGRRGRSFYSPPGENLYFTLVLRLPMAAHRSLPVSVPLAVCRAVRAQGLDACIKWPNDIWVGERKVCGILIDAESGESGPVAFPGIGINVNADPTVNPELRDTATSLHRALGRRVEREALLAAVCNELERAVALPREELVAEYRALSLVLGRPVAVHPTGGEPWTGTALRIADDGELVVARDGAGEEMVAAADVSVRPA
jgi:BirA family biotin operon repressor/biotin-[acetyl-CoA-carboxylase] ligase